MTRPLSWAAVVAVGVFTATSLLHILAAERSTPQSARLPPRDIPASSFSSIEVSLPAGARELGPFVHIGNGQLAVAQPEPGRVFIGTLVGKTLQWQGEIARSKVVGGLAFAARTGIILLDPAAREFRVLSVEGKVVRSFPQAGFERDICMVQDGSIVSTTFPDGLLSRSDATGRTLGHIGSRFSYENKDLDFALNAGSLACWNDRVYIGMIQPSVVRAYSLSGTLLWESQLDLPKPPPPAIRRTELPGGMVSIASSYALATLDIAADAARRIFALKSGLVLPDAMKSGSDRIEVLSPTGTRLAELRLPFRARRMEIVDGTLYLSGSAPFRLRSAPLVDLHLPVGVK